MKFFFTTLLISFSLFANAQTIYRMSNATNGDAINFTCPISDTRFADDGANNTHYSNDLDVTMTFCAPAGQLLNFNFGCGSNLTIERIDPTDTLFIYDGNSTASPLLYAVTGNPSNSDRLTYFGESSGFEFLAPSECITFRFKSDASDNNDGWDACITCVTAIDCNDNEPASDLFGGAPYICNLNGYCGTTSGDFGSDYPVNLNQSGGNCPSSLNFLGTIQNNSWVKFIADSSDVIFDFNVPLGGGCLNGIQTAILSYDGTSLTRMSPCALSDGSNAGNFQLTASGLTVGNTYYIIIDGNAGDVCDYTINANAGVTTLNAGSDQEFCFGVGGIDLAASGPTGATYTWNSLDGVVSNQVGQNITVNPNVPTTYVVEISGGEVCENQLDTVEVTICTLLSVRLVSFYAKYQDNSVYLDWETATETGNDFFTIERSIDAQKWEVIQNMKGAGNSDNLLNYTFIDKEPYQGVSYYRLKQIDYNGNFEYSNVVSIDANLSLNESLRIYPNPTKNIATIASSDVELSKLRVYNMIGQDLTKLVKVLSQQQTSLSIDISRLPKGMYYVKTKTLVSKIYKE